MKEKKGNRCISIYSGSDITEHQFKPGCSPGPGRNRLTDLERKERDFRRLANISISRAVTKVISDTVSGEDSRDDNRTDEQIESDIYKYADLIAKNAWTKFRDGNSGPLQEIHEYLDKAFGVNGVDTEELKEIDITPYDPEATKILAQHYIKKHRKEDRGR